MLTACPECRTTFRVSQDQLDAKRGLVRCGHCNAVFNAYDALLPEIEMPPAEQSVLAAPPPPVTRSTEDEPGGSRVEPRIELNFDSFEDTPEPPPPISEPPAQEKPKEVPRETEPVSLPPLVLPAYRIEPEETADLPPWLSQVESGAEQDNVLLAELELPEQPEQETSGLARVGRAVLILFLLLALSLETVYFMRSELAAWQPVLRPYMEAACAPFRCTVPLPRDRDALRVESSSLETDPESPASARLRVAFSNREAHAMAWPHIVLTLTDLSDKTLVQRTFSPRDYLAGKGKSKPGISPNEEYEALLDLNLVGLAAAGYRVTLEYP